MAMSSGFLYELSINQILSISVLENTLSKVRDNRASHEAGVIAKHTPNPPCSRATRLRDLILRPYHVVSHYYNLVVDD